MALALAGLLLLLLPASGRGGSAREGQQARQLTLSQYDQVGAEVNGTLNEISLLVLWRKVDWAHAFT